ncbi:MAG: hypothetical protein GX366_06380 [Epulopiscium sp.]|nr:hypothetical protein [Candidatus Epulonipiscium sp.]
MTPFNQMLHIRSEIISIYKKHQRIIAPILKFILITSVLLLISNSMGYAKILNKKSVIFITGLIGVFLPPRLIMLLFLLVTSAHSAAGSLGAGIIVFMLLIIVYLLFVRLYPEESLFIVATVLAFKFHIPYIIPLIAGLFSSFPALVALVIGIILWHCAPQLMVMMGEQSEDLVDIVDVIDSKITSLQTAFTSDQTLIANIIILSLVLLSVHIIKKQKIDFAEYMAIFIGTTINLIGFLIAIILFNVDMGVLSLILFTLICAIIAIVAQFFSKVVDYSRAESVQFEDDNNYYYVRVVPKINIESQSKRIHKNYTKEDIGGTSHEG